ncbi:MAG: hypothetical protein AAFQ82_06490, partial [Myxococcota bacterium]
MSTDVDPQLRKQWALGQSLQSGVVPTVETVKGPKSKPDTSIKLRTGVVEQRFLDDASNAGPAGQRAFDFSVRLRALNGSKETPTANFFTAWRDSVAEPTQRTLFGTPTPANDVCLVQRFASEHPVDPNKPPVVLVAGTGDNPIRAHLTGAADYAREGFPVYFFTPNNPNNAAPVVAEQMSVAVDFISQHHDGTLPIFDGHSAANGAFEVLARISNPEFRSELEKRGTFVPSTPLPSGQLKLIHRGHPGNGEDLTHAYTGLVAGSLVPAFATNASAFQQVGLQDLRSVDTVPNNASRDVFPGASSLLARQSALPPVIRAAIDSALHPFDLTRAAAFGALAIQPNKFTAYSGGVAPGSISTGIDKAAKDGGNLVELFHQFPTSGKDVERHVIFGTNPYNFNGTRLLLEESFGRELIDRTFALSDSAAFWTANSLYGAFLANSLGVSIPQLQGMLAGQFIAGDLRGGRLG